MARLFFIGDSITVGAWDSQGGWANRLIGEVMNIGMNNPAFYCVPYNLGVSGDTAPTCLARIEREILARCDAQSPTDQIEIVCAIGVNDSIILTDKNQPQHTAEEFKTNIEALIKLYRRFTNRISFVGLLPVDEALMNPIPEVWGVGQGFTNAHVKLFENVIREICQAQDIPFLPMFERWSALPNYKQYLIDGLHPNSQGHALMASEIKAFLITEAFKEFHSI